MNDHFAGIMFAVQVDGEWMIWGLIGRGAWLKWRTD